jgi:hypothetical protein
VPLGRSLSEKAPSDAVEVVRVEPSELTRAIVAVGIRESSGACDNAGDRSVTAELRVKRSEECAEKANDFADAKCS